MAGAAGDLTFFAVLLIMINSIFALLGITIFGDYSEGFRSFPSAFMTTIKLLVGLYDPTEDIKASSQPIFANVFLWSFQIISFFILLNALLAIIVESYDRTKADAEADRCPTADQMLMAKLSGASDISIDPGCSISEEELITLFADLHKNMESLMNATVPGAVAKLHKCAPSHKVDDKGRVVAERSLHPLEAEELRATLEANVEDFQPVRARARSKPEAARSKLKALRSKFIKVPEGRVRVMYQNTDGSFKVRFPLGFTKDLSGDDLSTIMHIQARLPVSTVQRIVLCEPENMKTSTRFYTINKIDEAGNPRVVLLDQHALVTALRIVCPTMNIACAFAVALNVLVRLGVNADINGDGFVSAEEWAALDRILQSQERAKPNGNRSRLIQLLL